jgi:hypothetical protein
MFRSHHVTRNPIYFRKSGLYRFDASDGSYGVLYAGADVYAAFVEGIIKTPENRIVTTAILKSRAIAEIKWSRILRLVDLVSEAALIRIGADARLFSANYRKAQQWSKALHDHACQADGILYPSRLDPNRHNIAVFQDRAPRPIEPQRTCWYDPGPQRRTLAEIAEHYRLEIIETESIAPRKPIRGNNPPPDPFLDL